MSDNHIHQITNKNENKTLMVIIFTVVTMIVEVVCGFITHSMALLADGFHMATHALALLLTYIAYVLIRKFSNSPYFPHGTGKIGILAAYTSSLFLLLTGFWIIIEAFQRLISPVQIQFSEAIIVAIIGLAVNGVCIFIMEGKGEHHHEHDKEEKDYNFKAAYYHIMADAMTSIFAIIALLLGKYFNIICLDAFIGILGGVLILRWAMNLIKNTVKILVDMKD